MSKNLLKKLEDYEQKAYSGGQGLDWLADVGEGLKFYVEHCADNGERVTFAGFIRWVDALADEKLS